VTASVDQYCRLAEALGHDPEQLKLDFEALVSAVRLQRCALLEIRDYESSSTTTTDGEKYMRRLARAALGDK